MKTSASPDYSAGCRWISGLLKNNGAALRNVIAECQNRKNLATRQNQLLLSVPQVNLVFDERVVRILDDFQQWVLKQSFQ